MESFPRTLCSWGSCEWHSTVQPRRSASERLELSLLETAYLLPVLFSTEPRMLLYRPALRSFSWLQATLLRMMVTAHPVRCVSARCSCLTSEPHSSPQLLPCSQLGKLPASLLIHLTPSWLGLQTWGCARPDAVFVWWLAILATLP